MNRADPRSSGGAEDKFDAFESSIGAAEDSIDAPEGSFGVTGPSGAAAEPSNARFEGERMPFADPVAAAECPAGDEDQASEGGEAFSRFRTDPRPSRAFPLIPPRIAFAITDQHSLAGADDQRSNDKDRRGPGPVQCLFIQPRPAAKASFPETS